MPIDHSRTYTEIRFRNVPHLIRLRAILRQVPALQSRLPTGAHPIRYADFGCSNGLITERVATLLAPCEAEGFDFNEENLQIAREARKGVKFSKINLNAEVGIRDRYDFVTCFETLEHVGNVKNAVRNIVSSLRPGGLGLIVVPIEHGPIGLMKFAVKLAYGYKLCELGNGMSICSYLCHLLTNRRMSDVRDPARSGWGTHFGFDYRDVADALASESCQFSSYRIGFNRFYEIAKA